jgi:hypothetical protein
MLFSGFNERATNLVLEEIVRSTSEWDFKVKLLKRIRKIEFNSEKINEFQSLIRKLNSAESIGKTLKNVGYAFLFPFDYTHIKKDILPRIGNFIPALISPLPDTEVYKSVLLDDKYKAVQGFVNILEVYIDYDPKNKSIVYVKEIEKVDDIKFFKDFDKNLSNEYVNTLKDVMNENVQIASEMASASLSSNLGLSYSISSKFMHSMNSDFRSIYEGIQKSLPPIFGKQPFYRSFDPDSGIFMKNKMIKILYVPRPMYEFDSNLVVQPYKRAYPNQTLASTSGHFTNMSKILGIFEKANAVTDLDKFTDNSVQEFNTSLLPFLDEEVALWLIQRRNIFYPIETQSNFVEKMSNILKEHFYITLPDKCIDFAVSNSPIKDGYERSFQGFYRLGTLSPTTEDSSKFARNYSEGIEGFINKSYCDNSTITKYLERMKSDLPKLEGENYEVKKASNALRSILMIATSVDYDETEKILQDNLNVSKDITEKAISDLIKIHYITLINFGSKKIIKRLFSIENLEAS